MGKLIPINYDQSGNLRLNTYRELYDAGFTKIYNTISFPNNRREYLRWGADKDLAIEYAKTQISNGCIVNEIDVEGICNHESNEDIYQFLNNQVFPQGHYYSVAVELLDQFKRRIEKLNKRAAKLGVDPITVEYGEVKIKSVKREDGSTVSAEYVNALLSKPSINLEGWNVMGAIEHVDNSALLFGKIGEEYRTVKNTRCDHCSTKHARVKQFVVKHSETEDVKVVGLSCLKDFVESTIGTAESVWKLLEELDEFEAEDWEDQGSVINEKSLDDILVAAKIEIDSNGYENASSYRSTKQEVLNKIAAGTIGVESAEEYKDILAKVKEDFARYSENDNSEFANNMKVLMESTYIRTKHVGIVAFIPEYNKRVAAKLAKEEARKNRKESNFVGKVGDRIEFNLEIMNKHTFDGMYGLQSYVIMQDQDGNSVVWKTGYTDLSVGDKVKLVARIKEHDESKYGKQTIITRPTIKEVIENQQ